MTTLANRGEPVPEIERALRERMAGSDFHRWAGLEVERVALGEVDVAMEVTDHHLNLVGIVHGGMLATLADTACGLAMRTVAGPDVTQVTAQLNIHFLAPAKPGRIVGKGRVVQAGSRIGVAEADVVDARGTVLARASATFAVRARR
jgi:uncharacterized protein (TIGR00369 family)